MDDITTLTDDDLDQLRLDVLNELERRRILREAPTKLVEITRLYQAASGRLDGRPWVQPTGAHDAYMTSQTVTHAGRLWESLVSGNTTQPGSDGRYWADRGPAEGTEPETPAAEEWQDGKQYAKGDVVTWQGALYVCNQAHKAHLAAGHTPAVPALWTKQS